jgi:hypothetical protein
VGPVGSLFSPLDHRLQLGTEGYSPALLRKAVRQSGKAASFRDASDDLRELAGVAISPSHLQRLTERVGAEWAEARDAGVQSFREGRLPREYRQAPAAAAVMLDGGRYQTRAADAGRGVQDPSWRETKVACCQTYTGAEFPSDPQPRPPAKFLDREKVKRLVASMVPRGSRGGSSDAKATARRRRPAAPRRRPRRLVRTIVATTQDNAAFGWQVAAEVHRRGLDRARRKACLGDGSQAIWALFAFHLQAAGFVAILDFVHLLVHLYAAAQAAAGKVAEAAWQLYTRWLCWAWSGKVALLLGALRAASRQAGTPPKGAGADDPRRVLAEAVTYAENNRGRMKYPEYRRQGLPISSAPVESAIKQLNRRVKGSEKFWLKEGAEAVLQVRAAYLSEDDRPARYWSRPRPYARAVGNGRLGRPARTQ